MKMTRAMFTAAFALCAFCAEASAAFAIVPALIPMPKEMKFTGGSVASIPPEGYELSISKDGVTIRHSDDAGLFYAKVYLDLGERKVSSRTPVISWTAATKPANVDSVKFKLVGVNQSKSARTKNDGVYVSSGFMVLVR